MRFTLGWLKDHLETDATIDEIATTLTAIGLEVDAVEDRGAALAVFTVATAVFFHHNFADQNTVLHFLKNLMIASGLLQISALGATSLSFDTRRLQRQLRVVNHHLQDGQHLALGTRVLVPATDDPLTPEERGEFLVDRDP